jgi:hypothetical protein
MLYGVFCNAPFRLEKFEATALDPNPTLFEALIDLVKSPILCNLRRFKMEFWLPNVELEQLAVGGFPVYERFVKAVADLLTLQELFLVYFLDYDWVQHFRNSQYLKSVSWQYSSFDLIDCRGPCRDPALEDRLVKILPQSHDEVPVVKLNCANGYVHYESDGSVNESDIVTANGDGESSGGEDEDGANGEGDLVFAEHF